MHEQIKAGVANSFWLQMVAIGVVAVVLIVLAAKYIW
jgi:hypothetical protein